MIAVLPVAISPMTTILRICSCLGMELGTETDCSGLGVTSGSNPGSDPVEGKRSRTGPVRTYRDETEILIQFLSIHT